MYRQRPLGEDDVRSKSARVTLEHTIRRRKFVFIPGLRVTIFGMTTHHHDPNEIVTRTKEPI